MPLRALLVWIAIAPAGIGHGILRVRFLNRRFGDRRARQIGVFTGSGLILAFACLAAPWLGASNTGQALAVGIFWLVLMLAFEVAFARLVFGASWDRVRSDFDPRRGGFLALGMLILFLAPWLAAHWRGLL
jgi:hypothetical protein